MKKGKSSTIEFEDWYPTGFMLWPTESVNRILLLLLFHSIRITASGQLPRRANCKSMSIEFKDWHSHYLTETVFKERFGSYRKVSPRQLNSRIDTHYTLYTIRVEGKSMTIEFKDWYPDIRWTRKLSVPCKEVSPRQLNSRIDTQYSLMYTGHVQGKSLTIEFKDWYPDISWTHDQLMRLQN